MIFENIKELTKENTNFRNVIYTGKQSQIVLMSISVNEDIGSEIHKNSDQIIFIVKGEAKAKVGDEEKKVYKHSVIYIPAGTQHDITNTGNEDLKLYTVYAPATHADGLIHKTKEDAMKEE